VGCLIKSSLKEIGIVTLGKTIIRLRMQKQWKQKDLAERLGIHPRNLIRWENDQVRPRLKAMQQLAATLGVSLAELETGNSTSGRMKEDPELHEIVDDLLELSGPQREAIKLVVKDMLALRRMEKALQGRAS